MLKDINGKDIKVGSRVRFSAKINGHNAVVHAPKTARDKVESISIKETLIRVSKCAYDGSTWALYPTDVEVID